MCFGHASKEQHVILGASDPPNQRRRFLTPPTVLMQKRWLLLSEVTFLIGWSVGSVCRIPAKAPLQSMCCKNVSIKCNVLQFPNFLPHFCTRAKQKRLCKNPKNTADRTTNQSRGRSLQTDVITLMYKS